MDSGDEIIEWYVCLSLEDRGMRFQLDRRMTDGVITCLDEMDERTERKENVKRQWLERRVMSVRVKRTDREKGRKCVFRGQKRRNGGGRKRQGGPLKGVDNGCIAENGRIM